MQWWNVTELCKKHSKKFLQSSDPLASTASELVPMLCNYSLWDILSPWENDKKGVQKKSKAKSHITAAYCLLNIDAYEMRISSATGLWFAGHCGCCGLEVRANLAVLPPELLLTFGRKSSKTVKVPLDLPSKNFFQNVLCWAVYANSCKLAWQHASPPSTVQNSIPHPPCIACAQLGRDSPEGSHKTNPPSMLHTCNTGLPRIHSPDLFLEYIYIWVINKVCGLPFSPTSVFMPSFHLPIWVH